MDHIRVICPQLFHIDRIADLHSHSNRFFVKENHAKQLQGGCKLFFFFFRFFDFQQPVFCIFHRHHIPNQHWQYRSIWSHTNENPHAVCPILQGLDCSWVHIRVGFNVTSREGQCCAAVLQMQTDLTHECHSFGRVIVDIKKLFGGFGQCIQKGTIERDDMQVFAFQRREKRHGVYHARMIG